MTDPRTIGDQKGPWFPVFASALGLVVLFSVSFQPLTWLDTANAIAWEFSHPDPDRGMDGNYLTNGDFSQGASDLKEDGDGRQVVVGRVANGWNEVSSWSSPAIRFDLDKEGGPQSKACQRIDVAPTAGAGSAKVEQMRVLPRGLYQANVWLKADAPADATIAIEQDRTKRFFGTWHVHVTPSWAQFKLSGYVPVYGAAFFVIQTEQPGTLWVGAARLAWIADPMLWMACTGFGVLLVIAIAGGVLRWFRRMTNTAAPPAHAARFAAPRLLAGIAGIFLAADAASAVQYQGMLDQVRREPASPERAVAERNIVRFTASELGASQDATGYDYHGGGISRTDLVAGVDNSRAVVWQNGVETALPVPPGASSAVANGVNAAGDVVGVTMGDDSHAVYWQGRVAHLLAGSAALPCSDGLAINAHDQVAGRVFARAANNVPYWAIPAHAAYWDPDGTLHDLGVPPGYRQSRAYGINDSEQIAGWVLTRNNHTHAALWEHGRFTDLGALPGADISGAIGIASDGWIAGNSIDANGKRHIVCWENGTIQDLGSPQDCEWYAAVHMNDRHAVLIDYVRSNNTLGVAVWESGLGIRSIRLSDDTDYQLQKSAAIGINGDVLACGVLKRKYETFDHRYFLLRPR